VYDGTGGEPDLRTVANGGHVENTANGGASGTYTVPADLVFSPNTDGSSPYDFEIEKYNAATGEIVAWVQCGVSTSVDTVFYMVYGNADVTTSQENVAGTWDANYLTVHHMADATTSSTADSTVSGFDGTKTSANNPIEVAGVVGQGQDFSSSLISLGDNADTTGAVTYEAWINADSLPNVGIIMGKFSDGPPNNPACVLYLEADGDLNFRAYDDSVPAILGRKATTEISTGVNYHIIATYDGGTTEGNIKIFVSGSQVDDASDGYDQGNFVSVEDVTEPFRIGAGNTSGSPSYHFDGIIDEVRVSNIVRSADYVTTAFNNQSSPSTFYSVGAEQPPSASQPYSFIM